MISDENKSPFRGGTITFWGNVQDKPEFFFILFYWNNLHLKNHSHMCIEVNVQNGLGIFIYLFIYFLFYFNINIH